MDLDPIFEAFHLPKPIHCIQLAGGANNRVYKLEFTQRNTIICKQYFQHPNDQRPRLQSEFAFLQYAWNLGIRNIPEPLDANINTNAALYSYLPGRPVQIGDSNDSHIQQLISFFHALNRNKSTGKHLPKASESCFSIQDYLHITEERMGRLKSITPETPIEKELVHFFTHELLPTWSKIKCKAALHLPTDKSLLFEDQCISPSDFGFHNALLDEKGLSFIDFEYAGWDDPCKTVCDLFCQPRVPLPIKYFSQVAESIAATSAHPEECLKRIEVVWPVMQMRWCCIILNVFTRVGKNRRTFSQSEEVARQEKQLLLAKEQLKKINL